MFKVGIIKALRKEDKPFVEVQVEIENEEICWYPMFEFPDIETNPQLDDEVILFTNQYNRGIVFNGKMLELMTDKDYSFSIKNIADKETGLEKDKIISYQDKDKVEVAHLKKDGYIDVKQANLRDSVTGSWTLGGTPHTFQTQIIDFNGVSLPILIAG